MTNGWASLNGDDVAIMMAKPNGYSSRTKISFTGSFYFNTDDQEAFWLAVKEEISIYHTIEPFNWSMCEFAIYDKAAIY